ncbi:TetR/AcrR family transcriptional regulator [Streptomyces sp. NPDC091292]|uniref:TetR/AcrR family transcriptional regulator n=1 Tax=Streptomyces sp. NPDC091292 TaxID=3365991 RepID=UPI0038136F11
MPADSSRMPPATAATAHTATHTATHTETRTAGAAGGASSGTEGLRADALLNRHRILEAARDLFSTRGLDVPMAAVARRAGVGVATLYRRFPTRESLVTEVFADQLGVCASVVDDALADPDPWRGFRTAIEKLCALHAADRGFTVAFLTAFPGAVDFDRERERAEQGFAVLAQRAKDAGQLRADFDRTDLMLVLMANCGVSTASPETAVAASRRLAALLISSFRADRADPADPLPPTPPVPYHVPWPTRPQP